MKLRLSILLLLVSFSLFGQRAAFFLSTAKTASTPPEAAPTTQASEIVFEDVNRNDLTLSITRGNGEAVLVVARLGEPVTDFPIDGVSYTASSTFGEGDEVGIGNFVIHNGDGTIGNITGLSPEDDIYIRAFERNGTKYNTDPAVNNPTSEALPAFPLGAFAEIASDFEDWTFASGTNGAAFVSGVNHGSWGDAEIGHTNAPTLDTSKGAMRFTKANGQSIKFSKPVNYTNPHEFMMVLEVIPSSDFVTNLHAGNTSETTAFMTINSSEQVSVNGVNTGVVLTGTKTAIRVHIENGTNASFVQLNKNSKVTFTTTVNNGNNPVWFGSKQTTANSFNGWMWAMGEHQGTVSDVDWEAIVDFYVP